MTPTCPSTVGGVSNAPASEVRESGGVPRVLTFAVVKRIDPQLPNTWGHWWIELGDESYGWWPFPCPMGWRGAMLGSRGCLNGIATTAGGTSTRDAYHGDEPDHWFHPTLIVDKTDDQVRAEIRAFAQSYVGGFRWQWWWLRQPAENCRTFQQAMFETVGLFEEPEYLFTRGSGCPFMYPFRRVGWGAVDLLASAVDSVRAWLPTSRGAERLPQETEQAESPLTDPRGRARARIRGVLPASRRERGGG